MSSVSVCLLLLEQSHSADAKSVACMRENLLPAGLQRDSAEDVVIHKLDAFLKELMRFGTHKKGFGHGVHLHSKGSTIQGSLFQVFGANCPSKLLAKEVSI